MICGKFEDSALKVAMSHGWIVAKCPECQRGFPLDIAAVYLGRSMPEEYLQAFCPEHWFKDSGICAYCKVRRGESIT
jgi:hypothetical protein